MSARKTDELSPHVAKATRNQIAAADPEVSAWVSANAGSGKTRVLTNRVVRLLLADVDPSRILCLTFTKAAAAEMANRLFAQLGEWAIMPDDKLIEAVETLEGRVVSREHLVRARRLFARAIETPGGLKIQTIHAFAQTVLGRFPIESEVSPHFEVIEERAAAELLAESRWKVIEDAETGENKALKSSVEGLTSRLSEAALDQLLEETVSKAAKLEQLLPAGPDDRDALIYLEKHLGIEGLDEEELLSNSIDAILALAPELRDAAQFLSEGSANDKKAAAKIIETLEGGAEGAAYEAYVDLHLTREGSPRKDIITKKSAGKEPQIEEMLRREQLRILEIEEQRKAFDIVEATESLTQFIAELLYEFAAGKARRGVLDYDDLIQKTARLLTGSLNAWVHFKLDGGIDHILIDEAQDTSRDQWRIIRGLAEDFFAGVSAFEERGRSPSRTIFAVGDEKQSIYSFQGAEPKEFDRQRRRFEEEVTAVDQTFANLDLLTSFRSTPEVLQAVDQSFAQPEDTRGLSFSGAEVSHFAAREKDIGLVELWPTRKPEEVEKTSPWDAPLDRLSKSSPQAALASDIAATIESWLRDKTPLTEGGRPIRPGDILILVRRRNIFVEEIIRELKNREVPVAGVDRMVLTDQMAVMDLMALADFALLPEDDLTLATVLKSPLVGLNEEELFDLAFGREGTLWKRLSEKRGEKARYQGAIEILSRALARVEVAAPYEFFKQALLDVGLEGTSAYEALLARLGPEAADPLEEFLGLTLNYERSEGRSLQGFMAWARQDASQIKREFDLKKDEVRVMTVHGAKGLEGKIVFLPDTCATPSSQNDDDILFLGDPAQPDSFLWRQGNAKTEANEVSRLRQALAEKRMEEYRRLLYVALTRAEDRLYICGYETSRGCPDDAWYAIVSRQLAEIAEEVETERGTILRLGSVPKTLGKIEDRKEEPAPALPEWMLKALPEEEAKTRLAPSQAVPGEDEVQAAPQSPLDGVSTDRFKRGRLIHALLEYLPEVDPAHREVLAEQFLARKGEGMKPEDLASLWQEVSVILGDPVFAPIFGPDSLAEVPIMGRLAGTDIFLRGQIDRLVVMPEQVLVIDYKTNRPPPTRAEDVARVYLAQMANYQALLRQIYPDRPVECALLWTHAPRLMRLSGELLAESVQYPVSANV